MGVFVKGYFILYQVSEFDDNGKKTTRVSVVVAVGASTYRIYMADDIDPAPFGAYKPGDTVSIVARPYVGKKGKLVWVDGAIA